MPVKACHFSLPVASLWGGGWGGEMGRWGVMWPPQAAESKWRQNILKKNELVYCCQNFKLLSQIKEISIHDYTLWFFQFVISVWRWLLWLLARGSKTRTCDTVLCSQCRLILDVYEGQQLWDNLLHLHSCSLYVIVTREAWPIADLCCLHWFYSLYADMQREWNQDIQWAFETGWMPSLPRKFYPLREVSLDVGHRAQWMLLTSKRGISLYVF
jgi:hypothetical protein